jgi:putative ABC transport system ATP-binding protein
MAASRLAGGALLEVRDLRFAWPGAAEDCIRLASLDLAAGERLFVIGPSGCGKSTLLSLLAGVVLPCSGTVRLQGRDWAEMSAAARDRVRADSVGYIFQQFNLVPYLSVLDNALLPCRFSARRAGRAGDPRAEGRRLLERAGLGRELWTRSAAAVSVGQQQRVAAVRALLGAPELVMADEPTSALDEPVKESFMELLLGACAAAGSALVFVSHDARLSARFDRSIALAAHS